MHNKARAMFAKVWVQNVCVEPRAVISEGSDGATDEVVAFV